MMKYEKEIRAWFAGREEELIGIISRLVEVPSTRGEAEPDAPFGPGPAAALKTALALAADMGLKTENHENYAGAVSLGDLPDALHILGHLDVVAAGDGWHTDPFRAVVRDGLICGRGVQDDKGPVAAALLALRCVKELGVPLEKNVRLILGTDEESGSEDLAYYYARHPYAPCAFSPDAEFPVVNVEKGMYRPAFSRALQKETALPRVERLKGGIRTNVVPAAAECAIAGLSPAELAGAMAEAEKRTGAAFLAREEDGRTVLTARGAQCHASTPEDGNNAITALLALLRALPLAECESTHALRGVNACFPHGDNAGTALGIAQSDELSGALTCALTLLELSETGLSGQADCRTPLCAGEANCRLAVERALARAGFRTEGGMKAPHHTPSDTPFVAGLLQCYEAYTGRPGECLSMGGGTYVHDIPNGVAFGCVMPGFDSAMHGPDERAVLSDLLLSGQIFAQAIVQVCGRA